MTHGNSSGDDSTDAHIFGRICTTPIEKLYDVKFRPICEVKGIKSQIPTYKYQGGLAAALPPIFEWGSGP